MGFLNNLGSMIGGGASNETHTSVATELVSAAQQHPGGLAGMLENFKQNGMAEHVNSWQQPDQANAPISPDQAQQGLGSGVIEAIAQRTGLSPTVVKGAAAVILPMLVAHFAENGALSGGVNQQGSGFGNIASSFLGKLL
jgi:uncharacterized protein YidB (DUF937 family)